MLVCLCIVTLSLSIHTAIERFQVERMKWWHKRMNKCCVNGFVSFHNNEVNGFHFSHSILMYHLFVCAWIWKNQMNKMVQFVCCELDLWSEVAMTYKHLTSSAGISQFELGFLNFFNYFYFFMFVNTVRKRKNVKCKSLSSAIEPITCVVCYARTVHSHNIDRLENNA